jgi:outer membrane protein assembly factor BamE
MQANFNLSETRGKPANDSGIQFQMQKIITHLFRTTLKYLLVSSLLVSIQACSFPGVYKINIQQGNIVTQDMLDKLKPGMNRNQVHFVLGNPVLENTFDNKIEHYIYTYQKSGGDTIQQRVTVYYDKDKYLRYEGKLLPHNPAY